MWYVWQGNDRVSHSTPKKNGSLVIVLIDWLIVFVVFVVGFSLPMRVIPNEWMNEVVRQCQASYTTTQPCPACLPACVAASCVKLFPYGCLQGRGRGGELDTTWNTRLQCDMCKKRERERSRGQIRKNFAAKGERWGEVDIVSEKRDLRTSHVTRTSMKL